jgi:hypothetical protein
MVQTGDALVAAHKKAIRNLRLIGIAFPILFIGLIGWNLMSIADLVKNIDGAAVGTQLSNHVNALMPDIDAHLGDVADAVQPALFSALETEAMDASPQIESRLRTDIDHSMSLAKDTLERSVGNDLVARDAAMRAQLVAAFPELASDQAAQDVVLASARGAAGEWSKAQLDALVGEHIVAMDKLRKTLESSYSKKNDQPVDAEDALMALLDLMNEHIGGSDEILATADSKSKKPSPAARAAGKK